jgi:2-haloacid dehalogenase
VRISTGNYGRRHLLRVAAAALCPSAMVAAPRIAEAARGRTLKALAIDGVAVFDLSPVAAKLEHLLPGRSAALLPLWRTRQFEYSWLRTVMGRYVDFWQVSDEALEFAAQQLHLDLDAERRDQVMQAFLSLKVWPDVRPALVALRDADVRLALLSNFTERMLIAASSSAGIADLLEPPLSTDRVGVYKPHPRAYQMGPDAFGLPRENIGFAAYGGWDAAGARAFGYPTFWVNRDQQADERLGAMPDAQGKTFDALVTWTLRP